MMAESVTTHEHPKKQRGPFFWRMSVVLMILVGFGSIAWMLDSEFTKLRRELNVLRAEQDNRFIVDQREFSPGQGRFTYGIHHFDSPGDFLAHFDSRVMSHYVPPATYGETWLLEDANFDRVIKLGGAADESFESIGITPGTVLRVVRVENS